MDTKPYVRHDHDSQPDDYPITLRAIQLAERIDNSRRLVEAGLVSEGEFMLAFAIWQIDFQELAASVIREMAIAMLKKEHDQ